MPLFILAGKALFSLVWLVLVWNLIAPFPGNTAYALYAMFAFMLIMHGIQSAIFIRAFAKPYNLNAWEKWSFLFFGVFALLHIRQKYMQNP